MERRLRVYSTGVPNDDVNADVELDAEEPGLDLHEWEARYQQLLTDLEDDPVAGLPELTDLLEELLVERGYELAEEVTREGQSPDVVREYEAAREVSDRVERGEDVDPGDVAHATEGLRAVYDHVTTNRPG